MKTLLIDGPYLAHRSHAAPFNLTTKDGLNSTMIYSFITSLNALKKKFKPDEIIIAWESHGTPSWRKDLSPTYKPSKGIDPSFISQIKDLQLILYHLGATQYNAACNEADDVIATYVQENPNKNIIIFTVDKDIKQLISKNISVYDGHTLWDETTITIDYDITPKHIPDLLALAGDKADNIEGIKGIGIKKASQLIIKYGCVENLPFNFCSSIIPNPIMSKILLNKKLATLNKNCTLINYQPPIQITIESLLDKYELKKIKENINDYKISKSQSLDDFF